MLFDPPSTAADAAGQRRQRRALTLVLSPMDTFMAANVFLDVGDRGNGTGGGGVLQYGVQGKVSERARVCVWMGMGMMGEAEREL